MSSIQLPPPERDTSEVEVPLPPSVNNLFRTTGYKRFKTREYREWIEATGRTFARLIVARVYPVEVWVKVTGRVNPQRDIDNFAKPLLDAVVAAGVVPDDTIKYVDRVDVWYEPGPGDPRAVVTVCEREETSQ